MLNMLQVMWETLWFLLPAMVANIAPTFADRYSWWSTLNHPVDRGFVWREKRILGDHKTVRGFACGILFGSITGLFQHLLWSETGGFPVALFSYDSLMPSVFLGAWLGLAALVGDSLGSFIKRRLDVPPGKLFVPLDQIDIVLGVLLFTFWFVPYTFTHVVVSIVLIGVGMFVVSAGGVALGIKKSL